MALNETIVEKEFGNGDLHLEMDDGDLVLTVMYDGKGFDGELKIVLDPEYFLDQLAAAIPGKIDDAVIGLIKGAFFESNGNG